MYSIFFHITGLSLIEILFYFYYIGPMETIIFKNAISDAFKNSLNNELSDDTNNPIYIVSPFNSSQLILIENKEESKYSNEFQQIVSDAERKRKENNTKLFYVALFSWSIIFTISIVYFIIEMLIRYYFYKNKNNLRNISSINSLEMITIPLDIEKTSCNNDNNKEEPKEYKFIKWDKIIKNIKYNIVHYSILLLLIVLFEYWFFNKIILKYDIVSMKELEYMLYKKTAPIINNYINNHVKYSDDN